MTTKARHSLHCSWTPDYWLAHSEGYRVDTPEGHLGFVEEIVHTSDGEPCALRVRTGFGPGGLVRVPLSAVRDVEPAAESLVVRGTTERRSGSAPMIRPRGGARVRA